MSKDKIAYNPYLTVAENADNNNVSVYQIRKYIRVNGIDRKRDNAIIIHRRIKDAVKKNPDLSIRELSRRLHVAVNTVRKYIFSELIIATKTPYKVSTFDTTKNKTIIKSISTDQHQILNNILRLYVPQFRFDCDLTYSIGQFYKRVPQPILKFDMYPQTEDTQPLSDAYELPENCLTSVIMDLPFILCTNREGKTFPSDCKIANRFNYFKSPQELYQTNKEMIELVHAKLKKRGIFVVKTMDTILAGKQYCVSNFVMNTALEMGFEWLDTFILINETRLLRSDWCVQHHARKMHSYFFVFRKKK